MRKLSRVAHAAAQGAARAVSRACLTLFLLALGCLLCVNSSQVAAQGRQGSVPPRPPAASASQEFARLAGQAEAARTGDHYDEAVALYRKALALNPKWDEGWWYLATLLYDRDAYAEAAPAFAETTRLQPKVGAPWGLLGLCEFQLGRYDEALAHIQRARQLGVTNNPDLIRVLRYHEGLLWLVKGDFETAQLMLDSLGFEGVNSEGLIVALGLTVLRMPMLPSQIDARHRDHELIRRAGWAEQQSARKNAGDAQREYERLVADFPRTPNVQYAYGHFLLAHHEPEQALAAFQRELEISPEHVSALLQVAYIKLNDKDAPAGLPFAERAVKLYPRAPLGHYLYGRLLFDAGQNERAIEELETAQRLVPDEPKIYFALARAYTRAKRKEDAARAREAFTRLNARGQEARDGSAATLPEGGDEGKPDPR